MLSLIVSLLVLIIGYLLYSKFVEKILGPDDRYFVNNENVNNALNKGLD